MTCKRFLLLLTIACCVIIACNQTGNNNLQTKDTTAVISTETTDPACKNPVKYPNQDKPMALMMRQMADNAQLMKEKLEAGETLTAQQFPFIRFHLVEPTDPNILQPQFYENARLFQEAHKAMVEAPMATQKELYTAYINQCINCHQTYCSGPLKRIRKLVLTQP